MNPACNELAANAFKFGALGNDGGKLSVQWSIKAGGFSQLQLHRREWDLWRAEAPRDSVSALSS